MKNARFYLASIFILLGLLCFGCSNAANDTNDKNDSGDKKNITATPGDNGITVTVDAPEGCTIIYFLREEKGTGYIEAWYNTEKATSGVNSILDCFTTENKTYTYYADFYKPGTEESGWVFLGRSDSVDATASATGKTIPRVTNSPVATYDSDTKKLTFTTKPEFSSLQSPLSEYPNLLIELVYKCADTVYEPICTYVPGSEQTGAVYDYIFERYKGKTLKYHSIRYKMKSADGKSSYEFDSAYEVKIDDITIPNATNTSDIDVTPLDLSECIPTAESMKNKILCNKQPWHENENSTGPGFFFYVFANTVENGKIAITRKEYRYNGTYENLTINDPTVLTDDKWSYNGTDGKITQHTEESDETRDIIYCIDGKYYLADEEFAIPRVGSTTGLIGATFSLTYDTDFGNTTMEFKIKNSTTVHIKMTVDEQSYEGDATATYTNGVCKLSLPDNLKAIMETTEMHALYTGTALVPVYPVKEYGALPDYNSLLTQ